MPKRVIAFAGSGLTTLENAAELLNNWLTEDVDVEDFYVPAKISKRTEKGLANVVSYLTDEWQGFKTADPAEFIGILQKATDAGHEPFLVVIVGDETPDDVTADLVEAALEAEIPVKDLAAGLDDVTESGEDTEQAPPEPERAPERPTRRRRASAAPDLAKPAETVSETRPKRRGVPRNVTGGPVAEDTSDTPPWKTEDPGEARERATAAGIAAAQKHSDVKERAAQGVISLEDYANPLSVDALANIRKVVSDEVRRALADLLCGAVNNFLPGGDYAVSVSVVPAQTGPTTAFIKDLAEGTLRKRGRGKPKTGEEVVFLTSDEIEEATEKGLIDR